MVRGVLLVLTLAGGLAGGAGVAIAGCPDNSHPVEMVGTTQYCECNKGFEKRGGACRPVLTMRAMKRADCIRFAGYQLREDLARCEYPLISCLKNGGVRENVARCAVEALIGGLVVAADPTKSASVLTLSVTGALAGCKNEALEVAEKCAPAWGTCEQRPLKTYRDRIQGCPTQ